MCNTVPCAVHCVAEFEPWTPCSKSCGTGVTRSDVVVLTPAAWGGDVCPDAREELCNTFHCSTATPTPSPTPPSPAPTPYTSPTPAPSYGQPILVLDDADYLTIEASVGAMYTDAGATCTDPVEGLVVDVSAKGVVFPHLQKPGTYEIEYMCHNSRGTAAVPLKRFVYVRDTQCPTCTVAPGPATVEASFAYVDPGAACSDTLDGALTHEVIGTVDTEHVGTYYVTYRAQDKAQNWNDGAGGLGCSGAQNYVRTVNVVDTLMPVIHVHYRDQLVAKSAVHGTGAGGELNPVATYASAADLMAEAAAPWRAPRSATLLAAAAAFAALAAVALLAWSSRRSHRVAV
jgi:hypothetical protein